MTHDLDLRLDGDQDRDIAAALGSHLVRSSVVGWGDAAATSRLHLADGRTVAARRLAGPDAAATSVRIAKVMQGLADAGLPVPAPMVVTTTEATYLVTSWIEGAPGAAWLDEPDRARHLASVMGALAGRLRLFDPGGLGLGSASASSVVLAAQATSWLEIGGLDVGARARRAVEEAIAWLGAAQRWHPTLVHGDFAPINVILASDGELLALLDFEHVRLGSPTADVAWWGWVVGHHHPAAWDAAWPTFCASAGLEGNAADAPEVRSIVAVRLLEAAATARDAEARARWVRRLAQAT